MAKPKPASARASFKLQRLHPETQLYLFSALLGVLIIAINVTLWAPGGSYWLAKARQEKVQMLTRHNRHLSIRNDGLQAEIDSLQLGLDAVEDRARTSLGLIGPGETLYLLIDRPATQRPPPRQPNGAPAR